jgi:hypothetical protein
MGSKNPPLKIDGFRGTHPTNANRANEQHCKKYNSRIPSFGKGIPNIGKEILLKFSPSHTNINLEVLSYI